MWELFFTIYITLNSSMIHYGSYESIDECTTAAHGEARDKVKDDHPKAAVAGYCVSRTFVARHLKDNLKILGWH